MEKSKTIKLNQSEFIKGENFIIFGEDFARYPNPLEHMMRPLFSSNRFIWVETIGLRSPRISLYDLKRIIEKLKKWFGLKKIKDNNDNHDNHDNQTKNLIPESIIVLTPFMIPFTKLRLVRIFNRWNVLRLTKQALITHQMVNPITVVSVPNACDFIGAFSERLKVYYCSDEFSLWPGLDTRLVGKFEKKLIANADLIIATSKRLTETKSIPGKSTSLITHGVEFDHFNIGPKRSHLIKTETILKLCYFGLFDERSDQDILKAIATTIPSCEIHIMGDVVCNIKKLSSISNILFHGKISYQLLPSAIKEMDIFLLPYVRNELTNNINPLKLKEYLLTGRPVVATDLPEVVKFNQYLHLGKNSEEFISIIKGLQNQTQIEHSEEVIRYIKEHETWEAKARHFSLLIQTAIQ